MQRLLISVPTLALGLPLRESLEQAASLGAGGVQLDLRQELQARDYGETARRQLLHLLKERDLRIASAHFPLRSPLAAREQLDQRLAALKEALEFAGKLRIGMLTLRTGRIPSEEDAAGREVLLSVLRDLAGMGNRTGVVVSLLPAGDTAADLRSLLGLVQTGPVLVAADPAGWLLHGQRPVTQLRELHDLIGHFEVRDAIRDVDGSGREVPLGRGELDWDELAALIEEIGYTGWLNVNRTLGEDRAGDIARGVQFVRNVIGREG